MGLRLKLKWTKLLKRRVKLVHNLRRRWMYCKYQKGFIIKFIAILLIYLLYYCR